MKSFISRHKAFIPTMIALVIMLGLYALDLAPAWAMGVPLVFGTTFDKTGSGPTLGQVPFQNVPRLFYAEQIVDLTAGAITENDVYQCIAVPANTLVCQVELEIVTAAVGTTLTMDVGDGSGVDSWDANVDGKGVAGTITLSAVGTDAYAAAASIGKRYSTADSIDVVMDVATAITSGPKFKIRAWGVYLG